jgi:hypothetical protein
VVKKSAKSYVVVVCIEPAKPHTWTLPLLLETAIQLEFALKAMLRISVVSVPRRTSFNFSPVAVSKIRIKVP